MAREDYYSLLGIDKHAPDREVKRAYYGLARDLHPDKAKTPEDARANAERLAVISKAYNTLKDPKKRAEYDGSGGGGAASSTAKSVPKAPAAPVAEKNTKSAAAPAPEVKSAASAPPTRGANPHDLAAQRVLTAQKAFIKGMEYYRAGDYKKAIPFLETASTQDPDSEAQYHIRYAMSLMKTKGSFTKAVAAAEKAVQMDTYNVDYKLALGELYESAGVPSKALTVYEDVLKWESENDKAKLRITVIKQADNKKNASFLAKMLPSVFGKK